MDKGVEDALRAAGLWEGSPQTDPDLETGEIATSPPAEHPLATSATVADASPETPITNSPPPEHSSPMMIATTPSPPESPFPPAIDTPLLRKPPTKPQPETVIPPSQPQTEAIAPPTQPQTETVIPPESPPPEETAPAHTEGTSSIPQHQGRYAVPAFGDNIARQGGRSWTRFQKEGALPRFPTLESVATGLEDLWEKFDTTTDKLYLDLNSINDRRRRIAADQDGARKEINAQASAIQKLERENAELRKKLEIAARNEQRDKTVMLGRINMLTELYQQLTGYPLPLLPQAPPSAADGSEVCAADRIQFSSRDMYTRYNEGYEDALINLAGGGLLKEEVMKRKDMIPPEFKRSNEMWYALRHAKQIREREAREPPRHLEGPSHGKE